MASLTAPRWPPTRALALTDNSTVRRFSCQFQVETTTKLDSAQDTQGVFAELVARVPEDGGLEVLPAAVR